MSIRTLLIIVLALVIGGIAAGLARTLIDVPVQQVAAAEIPMKKVVVTKVAVERGTLLTKEHLDLKDFPKDYLPQGALSDLDEALDRVPMGLLGAQEVVSADKLAPKGDRLGLKITPGYRAVTISLPSFAATGAGLIQPGERVDVMGTLTTLKHGTFTATILQRVKILAIYQRLDASAGNRSSEAEANTVTLELTPDDAQLIELAQNRGSLKLVMRSLKDSKDLVAGITKEDKLDQFGPRSEPEKPEPIPVAPVEVAQPVVKPEPMPVTEVVKEKPKEKQLADWVVIVTEGKEVREVPFFKGKKINPEQP